MKAVTYEAYGSPDVLRVQELPEPPIQKGHARVQVHAAALNPKDVLVRKGKMRLIMGKQWPRIPGYDIAGVLLNDVAGLKAGAEVFGMINSNLGGACAEVVSLPADEIAAKPTGLTMVEAASLPLAGMTALQALRDELLLESGQRVLLNGASGGVGTLAVQIAKALGAEVLAVCSSRNTAMVRELGADLLIDYTCDRFDTLRGLNAVFDIFGSVPWKAARPLLDARGRYCTTVPRPGSIARGVLRKVGLHRAAFVMVKSRRSDLEVLRKLVEGGKLRPIVDKTFSLAESAEGHRHLESKRARGKVVIEIA